MNYFILLFTSICWGSWGNALKFTKKYQQNLFYLDFTIAALIGGILIWLANFTGFGFINGSVLMPILGGVLFAFGNLLLVKAIDAYGFSLSFPAIIGGAVVVAGLTNFVKLPSNNPEMFFLGLLLVVLAILVDGYLYKIATKKQANESYKRVNYWLLFAAAMFIGLFPLFWNFGSQSLTTAELFLVLLVGHFLGIVLVTFCFKYLLKPDFKRYAKTSLTNHFVSAIGAGIWLVGTYVNILIGVKVGYGIAFVIGNIAPLFSVLWGIFYWKEIDIHPTRNKLVFGLMAILFFFGMVLIGNA